MLSLPSPPSTIGDKKCTSYSEISDEDSVNDAFEDLKIGKIGKGDIHSLSKEPSSPAPLPRTVKYKDDKPDIPIPVPRKSRICSPEEEIEVATEILKNSDSKLHSPRNNDILQTPVVVSKSRNEPRVRQCAGKQLSPVIEEKRAPEDLSAPPGEGTLRRRKKRLAPQPPLNVSQMSINKINHYNCVHFIQIVIHSNF